jgi:basic amino acid/polyamine antiporter, APA family
VLRYRSPELPRTFRAPFMPVTPLLGVGFSLWLVSKLQVETWLRFLTWFLIGAVIYALYGYRHSKLGRGEAIAGEPVPDDETRP